MWLQIVTNLYKFCTEIEPGFFYGIRVHDGFISYKRWRYSDEKLFNGNMCVVLLRTNWITISDLNRYIYIFVNNSKCDGYSLLSRKYCYLCALTLVRIRSESLTAFHSYEIRNVKLMRNLSWENKLFHVSHQSHLPWRIDYLRYSYFYSQGLDTHKKIQIYWSCSELIIKSISIENQPNYHSVTRILPDEHDCWFRERPYSTQQRK